MRSIDARTTSVLPLRPAAAPRPVPVLPRALVLLGGKVRTTGLGAASQRSLLDLPVDEDRTVLDVWLDRMVDFALHIGAEQLDVRVLVDAAAATPTVHRHDRVAVEVERDAAELRGTGGALADLAARYGDDESIVVASGAQVLLEPLTQLLSALADTGGDVALVSHRDGTPSGLMLVRCGCMAVVPKIGYSDMKEQALPLIAKRFAVRVLHRDSPTALPIRTAADYIKVLRRYHRAISFGEHRSAAFAEEWRPSFRIVESGAKVHPSARIYDSVVLQGATIASGAVLVRSVACPGATVARDEQRIDQLVAPGTGG